MNRGIISRSAAVIIPVAQTAERLHLSHLLRWIVLVSIRDYQRYLSPYKGFSCAHRRFYGGVSCSEYFRRAVQEDGVTGAIPRFQTRLRACKGASRILNSSLPNSKKRRKKQENCEDCGDCGVGWCDGACIPLDICDVFELCDLDCDVLGGLDGCGDCGGCDCG